MKCSAYPFTWQSVVQITTTVTNRYDELDEVVCDLLSSLTNCSLGNGPITRQNGGYVWEYLGIWTAVHPKEPGSPNHLLPVSDMLNKTS